MKGYYIADYNVIVDGKESFIVSVSGLGFEPNYAKRTAEDFARNLNPNKAIAAVHIHSSEISYEEFQKHVGQPAWFKQTPDQ